MIAIQVNALKVGEQTTLVFITVMDEMTRGVVDEDEDSESAPTDRNYWEKRATKQTVGLADMMLKLLHDFDSELKLKFNKFYIGIEKEGRPFNFVSFIPQKNKMNLALKIPKSEEIDAKIDDAGLDTMEYNKKWGNYRIQIRKDDVYNCTQVLQELMKLAYERRINN